MFLWPLFDARNGDPRSRDPPVGKLLQTTGCDLLTFNEILQTILLGITAAGGWAIVQNI